MTASDRWNRGARGSDMGLVRLDPARGRWVPGGQGLFLHAGHQAAE